MSGLGLDEKDIKIEANEMKNKIVIVACMAMAFGSAVSANAVVYTMDRDTGQLYRVDTNTYSVTTVGAPLDANFLSSLTKHSNGEYINIDLTYLKGNIYGLAGNTRGDQPAMLFRISTSGALDTGFGNAGIKQISLMGQNPFMRSVEGLASNGNNLLIAHSSANESSALSSIISEYDVNSHAVINTRAVSSFAGAPSSFLLTDMDGLGAYDGRAMSVDIRDNKSHIIDLGTLTNGSFNDIYHVNSGTFGDVAFVTEDRFVVAGDYTVNGTRRNGLHFFSNVGGQASYTNTVQLPGSDGIFAVASTTENPNVIDEMIVGTKPGLSIPMPPVFPTVPDGEHYQCYMLEKGDELKEERIQIRDQFGRSEVVLGRPVMLCNPSQKIHNGKTFKIQDEVRHLVCYDYKTRVRPDAQELRIATQFGNDEVVATRRELFCAPAGKAHIDPK